jgi:hypothetical protein
MEDGGGDADVRSSSCVMTWPPVWRSVAPFTLDAAGHFEDGCAVEPYFGGHAETVAPPGDVLLAEAAESHLEDCPWAQMLDRELAALITAEDGVANPSDCAHRVEAVLKQLDDEARTGAWPKDNGPEGRCRFAAMHRLVLRSKYRKALHEAEMTFLRQVRAEGKAAKKVAKAAALAPGAGDDSFPVAASAAAASADGACAAATEDNESAPPPQKKARHDEAGSH